MFVGLLLAPPLSTVRVQFQEECTKSFDFSFMSYLSFDPLKTKLNLHYIYIYIYKDSVRSPQRTQFARTESGRNNELIINKNTFYWKDLVTISACYKLPLCLNVKCVLNCFTFCVHFLLGDHNRPECISTNELRNYA